MADTQKDKRGNHREYVGAVIGGLGHEILEYMVNGCWKDDIKAQRTIELWNLARESKGDVDVSHKIGGLLIYNQVIDEFLKDIVEYSIYYIKAEIWPASFALKIDFTKKTFGQNKNLFKQYATIENNREILISYLEKFNRKRNEVVHKLFTVSDIPKLKEEIDDYLILADEIIRLLCEYDNRICEKFVDLDRRVEFNLLKDE